MEDYSRYGYTLKYKDPKVYTTDPSEKKSPYHQGSPKLPPALSEETHPARRQWSRPEELKPQELYHPPLELILPPFTFREKEETAEIEAEEGEVQVEVLVEKVALAIEMVTGKQIEVSMRQESTTLVQPVVPLEEEKEEQPEEEPQEGSADEWRLLMKEGRLSLKPPTGTSEEDMERIAAYLVNLLGRGGEITMRGPEGIEIRIR